MLPTAAEAEIAVAILLGSDGVEESSSKPG
jgi:hypothetical protein